MALPVIMPKRDESEDYQYKISRWLKKKGDEVALGEDLFAYTWENDEYVEVSPASGEILEILYPSDSEVGSMAFVAVIGKHGESIAQFIDKEELMNAQIDWKTHEGDHETLSEPDDDEDVHITPRARKLADENNIDFELIEGSGKYGKITVKDIEFLLTESEISDNDSVVKEIQKKNIIENKDFYVRKLSDATKGFKNQQQNRTQNATVLVSANIQRLVQAASNSNNKKADSDSYEVGILLIYNVLRVLQMNLNFNSHAIGNSMKTFMGVHLCYPIDFEKQTFYPVVQNADKLSVRELADKIDSVKSSIYNAASTTQLADPTTATFSIHNLSDTNIEMFTVEIVDKQVAAIGFGSSFLRTTLSGDGGFAFMPYKHISLAYNNMVVSRQEAINFAEELKKEIENFNLRLVK